MTGWNSFSLNNKWSGGKTTWNRLPLPEYVFRQACVLPVHAMLDPKVGTETILCLVDPTDFIHELSTLNPFRLYVGTGLVRTDFGPVAFFLYHVPGHDPDHPFAMFEQTLNPCDKGMLAPYYDLARQTHWHVFLIDKDGNEVKWYEFENNFAVADPLDSIERATAGMQCVDFNRAKAQYGTTYTLDDLFQMTRRH